MNLKFNIVILLSALIMMFCGEAFAASGSSGGNTGSKLELPSNIFGDMISSIKNDVTEDSLEDYTNDLPVYSTVFSQSMAAFLCDIRRLFCSKLSITIIAVAIFIMGILILERRLSWPWAIVVVTAAFGLVYAEQVTAFILAKSFGMFNIDVDLSVMAKLCVCFNFF